MSLVKHILKSIKENESLSVQSRFYAKLILDRIMKKEDRNEKPKILFINKKLKK